MFWQRCFLKKHKIDVSIYCVLFMLYNLLAFNSVFFHQVYIATHSYLFCLGTFAVVWALGTIGCLLLFYKHTFKIFSWIFLIVNSSLYYFIKTYHISIEEEMLRNALQTNLVESTDLLNGTWFLYVFILGIIPALAINRLSLSENRIWRHRVITILCCLLIVFTIIFANISTVIPTVRNHKSTKYFLLPVNYISAIISTVKHSYRQNHEFIQIDTDSQFTKYWSGDKKLLVIFIVGETARAANFSLNGYSRPTNSPLNSYLHNIINYPHAYSCGTSTAVSVPCMFSSRNRSDFNPSESAFTENVLDIVQKNGYRVLWIENNSDCKYVCDRVEQQNPCTGPKGTCRDEIMLMSWDKNLRQSNKNTLLLMHQIGSHGPKYYKRYDKKSAKFKPTCNTEKINKCSTEELINTYDNTIVYTSQFIADTIRKTQKNAHAYNIVLFYVSDHGESLGENGLYLHSAPYRIAPNEQTHIPFFVWP